MHCRVFIVTASRMSCVHVLMRQLSMYSPCFVNHVYACVCVCVCMGMSICTVYSVRVYAVLCTRVRVYYVRVYGCIMHACAGVFCTRVWVYSVRVYEVCALVSWCVWRACVSVCICVCMRLYACVCSYACIYLYIIRVCVCVYAVVHTRFNTYCDVKLL